MSDEVEAEVEDPGSAFAALMAGAAEEATEEAPYGYTKDRQTGQMRPKKSPGRGGAKTPGLEELKAAKEAAEDPSDGAGKASAAPAEDRAPAKPQNRSERRKAAKGQKAAEPVPQFRAGVIAKGVNRLYLKAGKLIRVGDAELGAAIISVTKAESEDDVTVGEAWEDLAKTNPRIRAFLLKMIAGGAYGQLFMCHAPILLAVLLKPSVSKHIPFFRLLEAFLSDDDQEQDGEASPMGGLLGGMQAGDLEQMMGFAQGLAAQMGRGGVPRVPTAGEPGE